MPNVFVETLPPRRTRRASETEYHFVDLSVSFPEYSEGSHSRATGLLLES
jgi:hypothetical protein